MLLDLLLHTLVWRGFCWELLVFSHLSALSRPAGESVLIILSVFIFDVMISDLEVFMRYYTIGKAKIEVLVFKPKNKGTSLLRNIFQILNLFVLYILLKEKNCNAHRLTISGTYYLHRI